MVMRWLGRALVGAAALRRRMRGPLREAWPIELEAWTRVLHHYSKRSTLLPLAWQRTALDALVQRSARSSVEVEPVDAAGVPAAWFRPRGADPDRVLVYLHGGGYSIGSIASHRAFIELLARRANVHALALDYRLAPEHPFPAQLDDVRGAWRWLLDRGVNPRKVVLAGESAGGGLTMSTLVSLRDDGAPLPAAAVVLSPWVDLTLAGPSIDQNARFDYLHRHVLEVYVQRFCGDRARAVNPLISPLYADLRALPPLLVQVGGAEALLDDARLLAERARAAGVDAELQIYDDMVHAFMLFAGLPEAHRAVDAIAAFVRDKSGA